MAPPFGKQTPEFGGGLRAGRRLPVGGLLGARRTLGAGGTGTPAPVFLPLSGGASTCGKMWESAPRAERPERRMHHPSADHRTARAAVSFPAGAAYRGGVSARAMCPPTSLLRPGAGRPAPGEGRVG